MCIRDSCITLQEICNTGESWSEWGVLGSNISSGDNIKLAPREGRQFVLSLQDLVAAELGRKIEVLIYGDGAYHDPTSGIYELADPRPVFAATDGLNRLREGIKYKYLADMYLSKGASIDAVEKILEEKKEETITQGDVYKRQPRSGGAEGGGQARPGSVLLKLNTIRFSKRYR